jgi:YidC/Oxa1 family membrane protein insertase
MHFLGFVDLASKSPTLAVLAGISQYWQAYFAMPAAPPRSENATFQEDFTRAMSVQMRYVLPVFIVFVAYVASAAVALYWITSNIFMIGQELYVRRVVRRERTMSSSSS